MRDVARAAATTGGAAVIGMLFSAATGKIISIVVGPAGVGLYAVLLQMYATAVSFSSFGGGGNAVVQGVASRVGDARDRFIVTSAWVHAVTALALGLLVIVFAPVIPRLLDVKSDTLDVTAVRALSVALIAGTLTVFLSALVNAFREIGPLAKNRIWGSVTTALLAYPAALLVQDGAQIAFVGLITAGLLVQSAGLLSILLRKRLLDFGLLLRRSLFTREALGHFGAVAGTFFAVGQLGQISTLLITVLVVARSGLEGAGLLNVAVTITTGYLMLILSSFGTYYSPTLASAPDIPAMRKTVRDVLRVSLMAAVPVIVTVVVLKPYAVRLLYTPEFLPSLAVLRWMLIGDYLKIFSWVFAMPLSARAILGVFLAGEVGLTVLYYVLCRVLIPVVGSPEGVGVAFTLSYAVYLLFHVMYARRRWEFVMTGREALVWLAGFGAVIGASVSTWTATTVHAGVSAGWITVAALVAWWGLGAETRAKAVALVRSRVGR